MSCQSIIQNGFEFSKTPTFMKKKYIYINCPSVTFQNNRKRLSIN